MFLKYPNGKLLICLVLLVWEVIVCMGQIQFDDFQPIAQEFHEPFSDNIVFADLDGDEDQDLIFIPKYQSKVIWLANNGNGIFKEQHQINFKKTYGSPSLIIHDVDADEDLDIIIGTGYRVFTNDGKGNFSNNTPTTNSEQITFKVVDSNKNHKRFLLADDFDKDGFVEFFYLDERNHIFYKRLTNSMEDEKYPIVIDDYIPILDIHWADLDSDGLNDLVVRAKNQCFWFKQHYNHTFGELQLILEEETEAITVDDLDADGDLDIIAFFKDGTSLYRQGKDGKFYENYIGKFVYPRSKAYAIGDVTGDGSKEVIRQTNEGFLLFQKKNKRKFLEGKRLDNITYPQFIRDCKLFIVDINNDGIQNIIAKIDSKLVKLDENFSQEPTVLLDWIATVFNTPQYLSTDIDNNGYEDILYFETGEPNLYWYKNGKRGFEQKQILIKTDFLLGHIEVADINNDSYKDLLLSFSVSVDKKNGLINYAKPELVCYFNDGFNDFSETYSIFQQPDLQTRREFSRLYEFWNFVIVDLNEDGFQDILLLGKTSESYNYNSNEMQSTVIINILENQQGEAFEEMQALTLIPKASRHKLLVNKLKKIYFSYFTNSQGKLLVLKKSSKEKTFSSQTIETYSIGRIQLHDINNDGYEDILAFDSSAKLSLSINEKDLSFKFSENLIESNDRRLVDYKIMDLNSDGNLDILSIEAKLEKPLKYCVHINNEDHTFTKENCFETKDQYNFLQVEDLNKDQQKEILATKNGIIGIIPIKQ